VSRGKVTHFSDSSGELKSLFLIELPCSLLLVLFSMYCTEKGREETTDEVTIVIGEMK
jgi:hypothetical protein